MSGILLLPPPSGHYYKRKKRKNVMIGLIATFLMVLLFGGLSLGRKEIVANIMVDQPQTADLQSSTLKQKAELVIQKKNQQLVRLFVDGSEQQEVSLSTVGLEFSKDSVVSQLYPQRPEKINGFLHGAADEKAVYALILQDNYKRDSFLKQLRSYFELAAVPEFYSWSEDEGWQFHRHERGIVITEERFNESYQKLIGQLERGDLEPRLDLQTTSVAPARDRSAIKIYQRIIRLVEEPFVFDIAGEEVILDLESDQDFVIIDGEDVLINEEKISEWVDNFVEDFFEEPSTVRLLAKEKTTYNRDKAVVEGEFKEGQRIDAEEMKQVIYDHLGTQNRNVAVRVYEIPVRVYSALDNQELEILSVGWSEYSKGNAPNRVHNINTGIDRLDGLVVAPGEKISFNHMTGPINYDFREGYAIFGNGAGKSLGGGICQVSTTFFRALLNMGLPITMRRNHSWDLTYYREGGYGLDATIFPAQGLDVKAVNDYDSHLFFYTYTRPDIEEAFVVVYGVPDGREVALSPRQEYKPFYGAKTLIWDQEVTYADGEKRNYEIVSRYRK